MLMMAETRMNQKKKDLVKVIFSVDEASGRIYGNICSKNDPRHKIVFINGYKLEREWVGELPVDGEKWLCEVRKDTNIHEHYKGALLVKLCKNLSFDERTKIFREAMKLEIILRYFKSPNGDPAFLLKGSEFAIEIKKFAEEEIAGKKKFQELKFIILQNKNKEKNTINFNLLKCINLKYSAADFISGKNQLRAIVAWLERPGNKTYFRKRGNRDFECSRCGTILRLFKSNYKKLEGELKTRCSSCGANSFDD